MTAQQILSVVPMVQAASLVGHNLAFAKKKKKKASDFLGVAAGTAIGSAFIAAESDWIKGM